LRFHQLKNTLNGSGFQPDSQLALVIETPIVDIHVAIDSQYFSVRAAIDLEDFTELPT
jgi:hypothetical protein